MENKFGYCPYCHAPLEAIWFKEYEYKRAYVDGYSSIYKTGRFRLNVNYLYCPDCEYQTTVDDTFALEWR